MKLRKLFAAGLALVMTLAMAAPAFAADVDSGLNGDGSITISNASVGQTYSIYKVFDATYSGDNVSYTIHKDDSRWFAAVSAKTDLFTLTQSAGNDKIYVVSKNATATDEAIISFLQAAVKAGGITPEKTFEATEDTVKFTNVPYGYYVVETTLGDAAITVTTAKPDAVVIDKNQIPGGGFSKTVLDKTVQIGETANFKIAAGAPNYDGNQKITKYIVTDTMADCMDLVKDSIVVKVNGVVKTAVTDYVLTTNDHGFKVEIKWTDADGNFIYNKTTSDIEVTYAAKLNKDAGIDGASTGNTNTATLTWTKADGSIGGGETVKSDVTLETFALAIKKVNEAGQPLEGAQFTLKNGADAVKVSEVSKSDAKNVYVVDPEGTATIVTPKEGLVIIKGVDTDTYTLTEVVAPKGYNLLADNVTVTPVKTGKTTTEVTIYLDENGNVVDKEENSKTTVIVKDDELGATACAVLNKTGLVLPSTGGMGTTLFYIVGGLMVVCAGVVLVTKKRMGNK